MDEKQPKACKRIPEHHSKLEHQGDEPLLEQLNLPSRWHLCKVEFEREPLGWGDEPVVKEWGGKK